MDMEVRMRWRGRICGLWSGCRCVVYPIRFCGGSCILTVSTGHRCSFIFLRSLDGSWYLSVWVTTTIPEVVSVSRGKGIGVREKMCESVSGL